ncbi:MAG: type II toxin-antitoxin system RelE family toxin [Nocardioidaceae bacterium]
MCSGRNRSACQRTRNRRPTGPGHRRSDPPARPYRTARRGDYRVLVRIVEDADAVLVVRIDHRADVHRRR